MADVEVQPPPLPKNIYQTMLEPLNHGLAVAERKALELGVPTDKVLEMLLNHLTSVLAQIEPAGAREEAVKDIIRAIAPMTSRYVEARSMTPGGVILPRSKQ